MMKTTVSTEKYCDKTKILSSSIQITNPLNNQISVECFKCSPEFPEFGGMGRN